mmetsp:Transcript_27725/g.60578  ORF Transcript_27725/g.60578 Transcript_27725/m.60578 type:complete len:431 (-) Transcript_27725:171-1463(-)|eukprot:CAMPEP_0118928842 /NCGR_PEP_ID=MMETSP1169-20130426/5990_1 /TAXON_ID=36882 /ORGANISM="Pyramimonas obovata, Strain CCMP722" /LENGTH=430 /DNA_ID=CAMNT_0006870909 /DNA_START=41 /DNA_END=1333 /DNA_ORIENTATION=-
MAATLTRISQPLQARASLNVSAKKSAARMGVACPASSAKAVRLSARANGIARSEKVSAQRTSSVAVRSVAPTVAGLLDRFTGGKQKTVIITGASSGLGLAGAIEAINSGEWHAVLAVRDVAKMKELAEEYEFPKNSYTILELECGSLKSVRSFVKKFRRTGRTLDTLCCNAAIYLPNQPAPTYTEDGFEESVGVNHLSHFLLCNLMIEDLKKSKDPRCIIVGSITGNTNTVGGGAVKPFADLGNLSGLDAGLADPICMMDGKKYDGAKAYKDSKLANMMTVLQLHERFHESTGICFTSLYPGCIAETALFRQKRKWFRNFFPIFMKYVTGGYVSEDEAGERLFQVISSEEARKSGVYWSWNGGAKTVAVYDPFKKELRGAGGSGGELFENKPSAAVRDPVKGDKLWDISAKLVGLPQPKAAKGKKVLAEA